MNWLKDWLASLGLDISFVLAFLISFSLCALIIPGFIRVARLMGWVAKPKVDRWHSFPTALMGGIPIFLAVLVSISMVCCDQVPWFVLVGCILMFLTGLIDDLYNLPPVVKLIAQLVASALPIFNNHLFGSQLPIIVSIPITFIWMVGITNSFNLLDNMDGLSGGIAVISSAFIGIIFIWNDNILYATMMISITGACLGFLLYNFNPAKIFMGDSGSLFLGYSIASFLLILQNNLISTSVLSIILIPLCVLAIPIFDTTLVTILRTMAGRSVTVGGKDHSSHRMVYLGLSEKQTVMALYGISMLFGAIGTLLFFAQVQLFTALAIFSVIGLFAFAVYLSKLNLYTIPTEQIGEEVHQQKKESAVKMVRLPVFQEKRLLFKVILDAFLIYGCLVAAGYMRYEGGLPLHLISILNPILPLAILTKVLVFYLLGLYNFHYQFIGFPEFIQVVFVVSIASVLYFLCSLIFLEPDAVFKGVFFLDWVFSVSVIATSRFFFRAIEYLFKFSSSNDKQVLLVGLDQKTEFAIRYLRNNSDLHQKPGLIFAPMQKREGRVCHGLQICYDFDSLEQFFRKKSFASVLIVKKPRDEKILSYLEAFCRQHNLPINHFSIEIHRIW